MDGPVAHARSPGLALSPIVGLDRGILGKVGREVEEGVRDLDASIDLLLSAGKFSRRPGLSSPADPGSNAKKTPHRMERSSPMIPRSALHSARKTPNAAAAAGRDSVRKNLAFSRLNEQLRQREAESLVLGGSPMVGSKRISAAPTWWEEEDAHGHDSWHFEHGGMGGHRAAEEDEDEEDGDAGALGLDILLSAPNLGHHAALDNGGGELGLSRRWSGADSMASSTPMSSSSSSARQIQQQQQHHHSSYASASASASASATASPESSPSVLASSPNSMPSQVKSDAAIERIANAVGLARILARLDAQAMGETEAMHQALVKYESQARQARGILRCAVEQAPAASARWISTVEDRLSALLRFPDDSHAASLSDEGILEQRKGLSDALCVELRQALVDAETSVQEMKQDLKIKDGENVELQESVAAARNALKRAISVSSEEARGAEQRLAVAEAEAEQARGELVRMRNGAEAREEAQREAMKKSEEASQERWRRERGELERELEVLQASMSALQTEAEEAANDAEEQRLRLAKAAAELRVVRGEGEEREGEMAGLLSSLASSQVEVESLREGVANLQGMLGAGEEASKIRLGELEKKRLKLDEAVRAAHEENRCTMGRLREAQDLLSSKDGELASGESRIKGLETEVRLLRREMECEVGKLNRALAARESVVQEAENGVCAMEVVVSCAEEIADRCEAQLRKFGVEREEMRAGYASTRKELDDLLVLQRENLEELNGAREELNGAKEENAREKAGAVEREEGLREELRCAREALAEARRNECDLNCRLEGAQVEEDGKLKRMEGEVLEVKEALEVSRETIDSMSWRIQEDDKVIEELRVSGMALKKEKAGLMTALGAIRSEMEEVRDERDEVSRKLSRVIEEWECVSTSIKGLESERDALTHSNSALSLQISNLEAGMEGLQREKENAQGALERMEIEMDALVKDKLGLREGMEVAEKEKQGLAKQKEELGERIDRMAGEKRDLEEVMQRACNEKAAMEEALAEIKAELDKAIDERERMRAARDHMEGSIDEIRMGLSAVQSERGSLAQDVSRLEGEAESLLMEREQLVRQVDEMIQEVDDSKRRWDEQREELLMREREERWLRQKLNNATADLDAAQSKSLRLTIELQVSGEQLHSLASDLEAAREETAVARSQAAGRDRARAELEKCVADLTARCDEFKDELERSKANEEACRRTLEQERRLAREVRHKACKREQQLGQEISQAQTTISALRSENMVFKNEATRSRASELGESEVHRLRVRAKELEEALFTHHDLETTSQCALSTSTAEPSQSNDLASSREQLARVTERAERIEKERDELLLIVAASGQSPSLGASTSSPQAAVSPGSVPCDAVEIREIKLSAGKHRPRGLVARPRIEGQ